MNVFLFQLYRKALMLYLHKSPRTYHQYYQNYNHLKRIQGKDYIFVHINKTAGTSISDVLQIPVVVHHTAREIVEKIGAAKWQQAYKFSFVRNPWDKVVSQFHFRKKTNQTNLNDKPIEFKEWVRLVYQEQDSFYYNNPIFFLPQIDWLKNHQGEIDIDFIGRFERLNEDFQVVSNHLGIHQSLPHLNTTHRKDYRSYYDDATAEIIATWFKEDIAFFNYTFDQ